MTRASWSFVSVMKAALESRIITWLVDGSLVFHAIVALVSVFDEMRTSWMLGGVISAVLLFGDDATVWLMR